MNYLQKCLAPCGVIANWYKVRNLAVFILTVFQIDLLLGKLWNFRQYDMQEKYFSLKIVLAVSHYSNSYLDDGYTSISWEKGVMTTQYQPKEVCLAGIFNRDFPTVCLDLYHVE